MQRVPIKLAELILENKVVASADKVAQTEDADAFLTLSEEVPNGSAIDAQMLFDGAVVNTVANPVANPR